MARVISRAISSASVTSSDNSVTRSEDMIDSKRPDKRVLPGKVCKSVACMSIDLKCA